MCFNRGVESQAGRTSLDVRQSGPDMSGSRAPRNKKQPGQQPKDWEAQTREPS